MRPAQLTRKRVSRPASLSPLIAVWPPGKGRVPLEPLPGGQAAIGTTGRGGSGKRARLEEGSPWKD
jgi:hypothetical protein